MNMKHITLFTLLLLSTIGFAQNSKKVAIKFTYKGNPLCYWDVTLKYGDAEIAKGKTDQNGLADFGYVRVLSNGVDAYGYKKTANGDKKWDVKGYIVLAESGTTNFDFQGLVEEMGMGSMLESAWGLTLNDCSKGSSSSSSSGTTMSNSNSGSATTAGSTSNKAEEEEEMSDFDKQMEANKAKQKAQQDQFKADWESGKSQAEAYQNSKATLENKIQSGNNKIKLLNDQLAKKTPGTKEYSDLQYDIKETEIERDLNQVKLDKTNRSIAKGNAPLTKSEKEDLTMREDLLSQEADSLKSAKKSGALYGNGTVASTQTKTEEVKKEETKKEESKKETEHPEESKKESTSKKEDHSKEETKKSEEDEDVLKIYTSEELKNMSVINLKKLKLDSNSKLTNRKVALKTKKAMMKPEKIKQTETEIGQLEEQVKRIDEELAKRKETE